MGIRAALRRPVVLVLAAVALAAAGGIAWASIPNSNGVFTGCYATTGTPIGRLRVIDPSAGQACTASEKQITWNAKGLRWRGAWSGTTAYVAGDGVSRGGASYIALTANTNQPPPNATFWGVLAQKGAAGTPGAPAVLYYAEREVNGPLPTTLSFTSVPAGTVVLHVEATAFSADQARHWVVVGPSPSPDVTAQSFRYPTLFFNQAGVHMNLMPMTYEFGWTSSGDRTITLSASDPNLHADSNDFFPVSMTVYPSSVVPVSATAGPRQRSAPGLTS